VWVLVAIDLALGVPKILRLADAPLLADDKCPRISVLFAARDEAQKLPGALETLLALDYPNYEVIAVDDRSDDGTQEILAEAAARHRHLKAVRVDELPTGWLGKPHALQKAYERASGEWIVFTDADVHFAPDVLRRAMSLVTSRRWEHLSLLAKIHMTTIGEKIALTFFGFAFALAIRPWRVSMPDSGSYIGIGAFQMMSRAAYEKAGTHRRLAMEVVDDVKLGKLAKLAGVRSGVASAGDLVSVEWHSGFRNIVRGTTKNFFAAAGFQLWRACVQVIGLMLLCVVPFVALPFAHGWTLLFAAIAAGLAVATQAGVSKKFEVPAVYALAHPIGALMVAWMVVRSTFVTLRQGGIRWRGTFYPLEELRRGLV
jgi:GT2 family glycosyltransferase